MKLVIHQLITRSHQIQIITRSKLIILLGDASGVLSILLATDPIIQSQDPALDSQKVNLKRNI